MERDYLTDFDNRRRLKRLCVDYLGGACSRCGITDAVTDIFDFHHTEQRDAQVSKLIARNAHRDGITQAILNELNKCELVCSNCHRKLHYYEKRKRVEAGLPSWNNLKGRPPDYVKRGQVHSMREAGIGVTAISRELHITRQAVYKHLDRPNHTPVSRTDRIRAGLQKARANGKTLGRPRNEDRLAEIEAMRDRGIGVSEIARHFQTSRQSIYSALKRIKAASDDAQPKVGDTIR